MFTFVVNSEIELRLLELRDAEEVFNQVDKNREYLSKWLPWANHSKFEDRLLDWRRISRTRTDSVKSMINYIFNVLGLNRIEIRACTENVRSRAVPERLGFRHEGTIRHAELNKERYFDHEVYGLIAEECKARK